mmetsp:Transcript_147071/g.256637  ORF Transcript_147071/g.256637 Transcript_147071/m.256637 type:complete len:131 (-) Transcript_147071:24-416(-)
MPIDLTISGAAGLKAVAAAKAASAAAKQAAAQAVAMAQNTNLAALQAEQAQANLEKYVYGVPISAVPPAVTPMPPAALHPFPRPVSKVAAAPAVLLLLSCLMPDRIPSVSVSDTGQHMLASQPKDCADFL